MSAHSILQALRKAASLRRLMLLLLGICMFGGQSAEAAEKRVALVIGNNRYSHQGVLDRSASDAEAVHLKLQKLNFQISYRLNVDSKGLLAVLEDFLNQLSPDTVAVFYFAGHGAQYQGVNILLPTDNRLPTEGLVLARTLAAIAQRRPRFSLVIVDACRTDPNTPQEPRVRSVPPTNRFGMVVQPGDLSPDTPPPGMMVVYSAASGQFALDDLGDGDIRKPHGMFAHELLKYLDMPLSMKQMMRQVQVAVSARSANKQTPTIYDNSQQDFYLSRPGSPATPKETTAAIQPDRQPPLSASRTADRSPPAGPSPFSKNILTNTWTAIEKGECASARTGVSELIKFLPAKASNDTLTQRALRTDINRMFRSSHNCSAQLPPSPDFLTAASSPTNIIHDTWGLINKGECEAVKFKMREMSSGLPEIEEDTILQRALRNELIRMEVARGSCENKKTWSDAGTDGLIDGGRRAEPWRRHVPTPGPSPLQASPFREYFRNQMDR